MRVLFAGSPAIAVPAFFAVARSHELVGLLTNPDAAVGRSGERRPTELAQAALEGLGPGLPILRPERLDAGLRQEVAALGAELLLSFAYGKIFGPKFLALFPRGGLNVHPSLLPRHRGASPIQQAILDRDEETGVCVQRLALEMDAGDILGSQNIQLSGRETASALSARAAELGAELAVQVLDGLEAGRLVGRPQEGEASYCVRIEKTDGLLDWELPLLDLDARIRAFEAWPVAYTFLEGQRLNLLDAEPLSQEVIPEGGSALPPAPNGTILGVDKARGILVQARGGILALRKLQAAGRKVMSHRDFVNGFRDLAGRRLGAS